MRKFLLYLLIFFAAVVAIDFGVGKAGDYLREHSKSGPNKQFNDLCLKDKHDVIIMGSSRAHHHYVPEVLEDSLELDVYNAGFDGNGVILSYGVLQMIVDRYSPRCIIYDVEPTFDILEYEQDNNRTRYLSPLKPYVYCSGVSEILKDVSLKTYMMSLSGICRYNSVLINYVKEYAIGGVNCVKGYQPLQGEMKSKRRSDKNKNEWVIDSVKVKYLNLFIQCCKENDIKLIFALSPKFSARDTFTEEYVGNLAKQYDIPVLNYYRCGFFDNDMSLFNEPMHLNDKGAREYSMMIAPLINEIIN